MNELKVFEFLEEKKEFLLPNNQYFDTDIEEALLMAPENFEYTLNSFPFRKPSTVLIISFFLGSIGVDRFYLGDIGKGILKYFTFGGLGIWWIKDIITAKNRCRTYNCKKLIEAIQNPSAVNDMKNIDNKIDKAFQVAKAAAPVVKEIAKGTKDVGKTFYVDN